MILFHSETNFQLNQKSAVKIWVKETIAKEGKIPKEATRENVRSCDFELISNYNKLFFRNKGPL